MNSMTDAVIDRHYCDTRGTEFWVISKGTGGVVVEYNDGEVELISPDRWKEIEAEPSTPQ